VLLFLLLLLFRTLQEICILYTVAKLGKKIHRSQLNRRQKKLWTAKKSNDIVLLEVKSKRKRHNCIKRRQSQFLRQVIM
jgi:hypothetical protein